MRCRISDVWIREQLTAYSCGGSAGFSRTFAQSPASLLATKSCDQVDRDGYMWCDLNHRVNGTCAARAKFFAPAAEAVNNRRHALPSAVELTRTPPCR
jgi:hypothetical protein